MSTNRDIDDLIVDLDEELAADGFKLPDDDAVADAKPKALQPTDVPDGDDYDDQERDNEETREQRRAEKADDLEEQPEEDETEPWRRRAETAERERTQAQADATYQIGLTESRNVQAQLDASRVGLDTLKFRIDGAYNVLKQARDVGDTQAEVEIERNISDMRALAAKIEDHRASIPDPKAIIEQARQKAQGMLQRQPRGTQVSTNVRATHPLAERWSASNKWMKQSGNESAERQVIAISQNLVNRGWDPQSGGFYSELSRQMKKSNPNLDVRDITTKKSAPNVGGARSPVAPARSSSGASPSLKKVGTNRYQLTSADIGAMGRMRLDPKSATDRKYFARARLDMAAKDRV